MQHPRAVDEHRRAPLAEVETTAVDFEEGSQECRGRPPFLRGQLLRGIKQRAIVEVREGHVIRQHVFFYHAILRRLRGRAASRSATDAPRVSEPPPGVPP